MQPLAGERNIRTTEFLVTILHLAAQRDLWVLQGVPYTARAAGWYDIALSGPGGIIFRWLTLQGALRNARTMIETFRASGIDAAVWRPEDLLSGTVEAELDYLATAPLAPPTTRLCLVCGTSFEPASPRNRFDRKSCRNEFHNRARSHARRQETEPLPFSHYPPEEG